MKECVLLQQQQQSSTTNSTEKMPCWYFDKKDLRDTPSILGGITFETERRYRKEGARFIMTCGTQMGLGHNTMATGVVYFHRFYMFHSFKSFPRYVTACCCLLLAGKVEETPKKCLDIIRTARALLSDNQFYSFGDDPKEEVMTLERILLQTIKFDLQVEHPYTFLLKYAKCFRGDQQKLQKMVQMAWNFVNDSLSTVVCLQWEPEIIAVALIHLASKLSKFTVVDWVGRQPQHLRWWDMFVSNVTMEILEDICHQVLDLYQSNQKDPAESQSPPQKPPSRADSPTPMKVIPSSSTTTDSPAGKAKAGAPPIGGAIGGVSAFTGNNPISEINNIQAIKSLATPVPASAPHADPMSAAALASGAVYHMYAPPPPVNPQQIHSIYGVSAPAPPPPPPHGYGAGPVQVNTGGTIPPPLPQVGGYGGGVAPPSNAWPPSLANTHYASLGPAMPPGSVGAGGGPPSLHGHGGGGGGRAPLPPPPSAVGGYYQGNAYGRQQQQRY